MTFLFHSKSFGAAAHLPLPTTTYYLQSNPVRGLSERSPPARGSPREPPCRQTGAWPPRLPGLPSRTTSVLLTFFSAAALLHSDDGRLVPEAPLLVLPAQEAEAAIGAAVAAADGQGGLCARAGAPRPAPRGPLAEEAVGAKAAGAAGLALRGRAFPAAAAAVGLEEAPDGGAGLGRARRAARPVANPRAGLRQSRGPLGRQRRQEEQAAQQGQGRSHGRRRAHVQGKASRAANEPPPLPPWILGASNCF